MKKLSKRAKKFLILMMSIMLVITGYTITPVYADGDNPTAEENGGDPDNRVEEIINEMEKKPEGDDPLSEVTDTVKTTGRSVYNLLLVAGIMLSVIAVVLLGINFLFSSPQERQQAKGKALTIVAGIIFIAAAGCFVAWIFNVARSFGG